MPIRTLYKYLFFDCVLKTVLWEKYIIVFVAGSEHPVGQLRGLEHPPGQDAAEAVFCDQPGGQPGPVRLLG